MNALEVLDRRAAHFASIGEGQAALELRNAHAAFAAEHKALTSLLASRSKHYIDNGCCGDMIGWDERATEALAAVEKLP